MTIGSIMYDRVKGNIEIRYEARLRTVREQRKNDCLGMMAIEEVLSIENHYAEFVVYDSEADQATEILKVSDFL